MTGESWRLTVTLPGSNAGAISRTCTTWRVMAFRSSDAAWNVMRSTAVAVPGRAR